MNAVAPLPGSPYARAAAELTELGYHAIPVMPGEKAPGDYRSGRWVHMKEWQRFRSRPPSAMERRLWSGNYPEANVGAVLGVAVGTMRLVAVDIDAVDPDEFDLLAGALPRSPMVKRGAKGETRFYLAPASFSSRAYSVAGRRLIDFLAEGRQTVMPPSLHPTGKVYAYASGPVAAADLPLFGEDEREKLEDTLRALGWEAEPEKPARSSPPPDEDDYFTETKAAALANLEAWVPQLELYNCRRARGGYEAVAHWRASSSGRSMDKRKRNLSIQPNGVTDFGDGPKGYSAIDLVMAARPCERGDAVQWLRDRLGLSTGATIILHPAVAAAEHVDPETGEVTEGPPPPKVVELGELDDELTRVPGLLGELTDWIADTARRPQRGLSLGVALTLIGTAAGRKYAGPTRSGTHLYVLCLARTAAGKDHPLTQIAPVLAAAGMQGHVGPSQFMSISAVVNRITRHPLTLCAMDEMGAFMTRITSRRASTHERAITGMLRTLWSASFKTVAPPEWASRAADPIHSPSLSIFGVSTPEEFYASLGNSDIHNGFLNRFLLVSTRKRPAEREPREDPFEVPQSIKSRLHAIYGSGSALALATQHNGRADAPLITAAWADDEARRLYAQFGREVEDREADAAFFGRTVEMALRLATIRAIGLNIATPRITFDDMTWGRAVALWSAERMIAETSDYMAENENQAQANRIVRILKERGRTRHGDLVRAMQHQVKARDLKDLIEGLRDAGQIGVESERPPSGGPEARWYTAL